MQRDRNGIPMDAVVTSDDGVHPKVTMPGLSVAERALLLTKRERDESRDELALALELLRGVQLLLTKVIEEESRAHVTRGDRPPARLGEMRMFAEHSIREFLNRH